jgi:tRNA modification GTPase
MDGDRMNGSTIAAVSTAPGRGALAVVRVSGPDALGVADRLGIPDSDERFAVHATLLHPSTGRPVDDVVTTRLAGPRTYTGEDMLEISCHGGSLVPQLVLEAVCAAGARPAEPGEFTRRAYLNGKMDLLQAEAVLDLIDARSEAMHRSALFQLERGLSKRIEELREQLLGLQALLVYDIDFPEEDDGPVPAERIDTAVETLRGQLGHMLDLAPEGELLRDGALTVIAGRPNAGKSSVFNMLLGFERAIVTEEPGTTRDAIEALITLGGYPFRLVDTAGLRENAGRIEEMGIEVARNYLQKADLVLLCVEAGRAPGRDELEFAASLNTGASGTSRVIVLRTKADLAERPMSTVAADLEEEVTVSTLSGDGFAELRAILLEKAFAGIRGEEETPVVTRARHVAGLQRARAEVDAFQEARREGLPTEIAGTHVQEATLALEDLLGVVSTEDVLEQVFSAFCVGK